MKRLITLLAVLLILPLVANAATMGIYFGGGGGGGAMSRTVTKYGLFDGYVYIHNASYYITAVEYQLQTPEDPLHAHIQVAQVTPPENALVLGDPFGGHSLAFWPPLNGYTPGYNWICKIQFLSLANCVPRGPQTVPQPWIANYRLVIGPHPDSGELRGTYLPSNDFFPIIGLTSLLCPDGVGTEKTSWGAIKSLF